MDPLERFKELLEFRGASPSTLERYAYVVEAFLGQVGKEPEDLDKEDVQRYILKLRRSGKSGNYQRFVFSVLRLLFESIERPWEFKKRDIPKASTPVRPWFRLEEVKRLLEVAEKKRPLAHAIVRIPALTGCRKGELGNLKWGNYAFPKLTFKTLKHGEVVDRIIDFKTKDTLDRMMRKTGRMFNITGTQIGNIFRSVREEAGIDKPNAGIHALRRSLVTFLSDAGLKDPKIGAYMGWKKISTIPMLDVYRQLDPNELQKEVVRLHPLIPEEEKDEIIAML